LIMVPIIDPRAIQVSRIIENFIEAIKPCKD
jgi:hypothetical protein